MYNPEQDWLLPPSIVDELGDDHLALFIHRLVERLDLGAFEADRREQGRPGYPPQLLLKVWLYAYCVGVTSSPGAAEVAIDATRIAGNASAERSDTLEQLHRERARIRQRIRRWQKECERQDDDAPGTKVEQTAQWQQRLEEIPRQMEQLRKSGQWRGSRTDPESRYLRTRGGFCLGFTAEVAVSDDHLIVTQRVHQQTTDNGSAAQITEAVEQQCGQRPEVGADSGYYNMKRFARWRRAAVRRSCRTRYWRGN